MKRGFVSDNCAGAHPEVLAAILAANEGHAPSYGADDYCLRAKEKLSALLGGGEAVFVFNGTGANVTGLACLLRPYEAVICADCAHINADETGAPERVLGSKLIPIASPDGKLTPSMIEPCLSAKGNPHHSQPRVISITNVTEWGAVYTPEEVRTLADFAHQNGLLLHMDGARIANAAVAAGCTLAALTSETGLDVLSFGGVKNGLLFGEAVVFFDKAMAGIAPFVRKNVTQLQSKMRYIGAQYEALLSGDLWKRSAAHANEMAARVETAICALPGVTIVHPAAANMLFIRLEETAMQRVLDANMAAAMGDVVRLVASWDTQGEDIDALVQAIKG